MKLTKQEFEYLQEDQSRCDACGHLSILHNYHCCTYCKVSGCPCDCDQVDDGYKKETEYIEIFSSHEQNKRE